MFPTLFVPSALFALPPFGTAVIGMGIDPMLLIPIVVVVASVMVAMLARRSAPADAGRLIAPQPPARLVRRVHSAA